MLVRPTVGALNEAWELVRTRFIETTMAKDYLNLLDASGQEAFAALKRQFGESNLLNKIRKNYAFHYPRITTRGATTWRRRSSRSAMILNSVDC